MSIMRALYTLSVAVTLIYLVSSDTPSSCDMETHYMNGDKCCKMCGPGKRMLLEDNCEDPRCQDCLEGEYQSGYTSKTICNRQPICDTNLYFLPQENPSKTRLSKCQCKPGYYCTENDDCSMCMKHTVCKAGERIKRDGTSSRDTECEACESGTFSINNSASTCKQWTTCDSGYEEKSPGSSTSDRICEMGMPSDRIAILGGVLSVLLLLVAATVIMIVIKKKNGCQMYKLWREKGRIPGVEHEVIEVRHQTLQPEEDVDNSGSMSPTQENITENGNYVAQEDGKHSLLPSTETQSYS